MWLVTQKQTPNPTGCPLYSSQLKDNEYYRKSVLTLSISMLYDSIPTFQPAFSLAFCVLELGQFDRGDDTRHLLTPKATKHTFRN